MSEYYIQLVRNPCGNCLIWWRVGGHGYTCNLDEAWRVPKPEAERICRMRDGGTDVMWPAEAIDALAQRHVTSLPEVVDLSSRDVRWLRPLPVALRTKLDPCDGCYGTGEVEHHERCPKCKGAGVQAVKEGRE